MSGFTLRSVVVVVVLTLVASLGLPIAASATSGPNQVAVAAGTTSETRSHPCADGSRRTCTVTLTLTNTAHTESRAGSALATSLGVKTAAACTTSYAWPTYEVDDHNYLGQTVTSVILSGEDYWDGCTSGWVWVDLSCSAQPGYSCNSATHGSFWDSGLGASTAWGNQYTSNFCCQVLWALRMDVYPSGQLNSRYSN